MRIAIFDLGSTSFHLLVVDVDRKGTMTRVLRRKDTLHLAAAAARSGHVPAEDAERALRAARTLRKEAERARPDAVIATATSALRDAGNGDHLLERLEGAIKRPIRLLEGAEEAALAYRGACAGLGLDDVPVLVADLGGGSLDIAIGTGDEIHRTATFPLGASRLTALHIEHDPPLPDELEALASVVAEGCEPIFAHVRSHRPVHFVVAGGTGRTLARILIEQRGGGADVNGLRVPTAGLHKLCRKLTKLSCDELAKLPGVQPRRADVLAAGALIISTLADGLDAGAITISEWGLREGLLLELLDEQNAPVRAAR